MSGTRLSIAGICGRKIKDCRKDKSSSTDFSLFVDLLTGALLIDSRVWELSRFVSTLCCWVNSGSPLLTSHTIFIKSFSSQVKGSQDLHTLKSMSFAFRLPYFFPSYPATCPILVIWSSCIEPVRVKVCDRWSAAQSACRPIMCSTAINSASVSERSYEVDETQRFRLSSP